MRYIFQEITNCNMCGSSVKSHEILGKRLNKSQGRRPSLKNGNTVTVFKCNQCDLIYSNPMPIPFNIQDHYGVPPEEYWKEEYFKVNPYYFQGEIKVLKQLLEFKPGLKSLDIGAGLGKQMIALNNAGFDTYGFEPSLQFHERAIKHMNIHPDKLKLGMIEDIEYPESMFDFISFGAVLEHLYDPSNSIKKALKWLKPNGILHIEVPSANWLSNKIFNLYYRLILTDYVANISPMHEPFHLYEFGVKSFELNSKELNYEIAHKEFYVCQTYLPNILNWILRPFMKWTKQVCSFVFGLENYNCNYK